MDTEESIKHFLNSLSQLPGSILYRDAIDWRALPPGNEAEFLSLSPAGLPQWQFRPAYHPAHMLYPATAAHYSRTLQTTTNAPVLLLARFAHAQAATTRPIFTAWFPAASFCECFISTLGRLHLRVFNSANAQILNVRSAARVDDATLKYAFAHFTPATAALVFKINGQDVDDTAWTSRIKTTGTLTAAANCTQYIGRNPFNLAQFSGTLGPFGLHQIAAPSWQSFMYDNGHPRRIDTTGWTEFTSQPRLWHESGKLDEQRGSAGAFTRTGNILLATPETWP